MELAPTTSGGGGGGPAPFLLKTYDMVDDSSTDEIVSWSSTKKSFIVWNPPEFQRLLLPNYFKHNNFSSFIRQLNTYGFHKIDPERWEFANEDFMKDKKHLLKNIHRRKPIHSHSHPPSDSERAAFEEEIEKLTREKTELEAKLSRFSLHHSTAKSNLEDLTQRLGNMVQRQENLLTFLQKAVQNPAFVEHLAQKIEATDLSAYNKKRRLPRVDHSQPSADNNSGEVASIYQQDLSNKLKLELSTAVSNMNLISNSTNSSNEELFSTELSETQTCLTFKMDSSLSDKVGALQQNLVPTEESEGNICCQLNLSLASSPLQANPNPCSGTRPDSSNVERDETGVAPKNDTINAKGNTGILSSSQEDASNKQGPTPARVNDHFWEQFLTERPGSSDTEEASSCYRAHPHDEQENRGSSHGMSKTAKNLGKLTLRQDCH